MENAGSSAQGIVVKMFERGREFIWSFWKQDYPVIQLGIVQSIALQRVLIITHPHVQIKRCFDLQRLTRIYGWQRAPEGKSLKEWEARWS